MNTKETIELAERLRSDPKYRLLGDEAKKREQEARDFWKRVLGPVRTDYHE